MFTSLDKILSFARENIKFAISLLETQERTVILHSPCVNETGVTLQSICKLKKQMSQQLPQVLSMKQGKLALSMHSQPAYT